MPNVFRSVRMVESDSPCFYVISESPDSGAIEFLQAGLTEKNGVDFHFHLPKSSKISKLDYSDRISIWDDDKAYVDFELKSNFKNCNVFLFLSCKINLNNQYESLVFLLEENQTLELSRIITFIDARTFELENPKLVPWINANVHFSDAICFFNRSNKNAHYISKLIKDFNQHRYPIETYLISKSSIKYLPSILNSTVKRISHSFDPVDILEADDTPLNDPFLKKLSNGSRERNIITPFDF